MKTILKMYFQKIGLLDMQTESFGRKCLPFTVC